MPAPFSLLEFLEDRSAFTNQHGVNFSLLQEGCIHVSCPYPGIRQRAGQSLEIVCLYPDEGAAVDGMKVGSKIELNQVTPLELLKAYMEGRMLLSCLVERGRRAGMLLFKRDGWKVKAVDEDTQESHEVRSGLHFGEDYLAYTAAYFHLC